MLAPSLATRPLEGSSQRTRAPPGKRQSAGRRSDDSLSRSSGPRARSKETNVSRPPCGFLLIRACVRACVFTVSLVLRRGSKRDPPPRVSRGFTRRGRDRACIETPSDDDGDGEVSALKSATENISAFTSRLVVFLSSQSAREAVKRVQKCFVVKTFFETFVFLHINFGIRCSAAFHFGHIISLLLGDGDRQFYHGTRILLSSLASASSTIFETRLLERNVCDRRL